jgi:hypothetical protein
MKRSPLLGGIAVLLSLSSAMAGDAGAVPPPSPTWWRGLPFDFTARTHSRSVRVSDACWRTCETQCARRFHACATAYPVNDCRMETDACDLACVDTCRTYGGPLLGITNSRP